VTDPTRVELVVPPELVELIAARAAELAVDALAARPERWLDVAAAAEHLCCSKSRLYSLASARRVPFSKDGSRLMFRASELDAWVETGGGVRP
jgi:excisionase family DNA binding protein